MYMQNSHKICREENRPQRLALSGCQHKYETLTMKQTASQAQLAVVCEDNTIDRVLVDCDHAT